jgi:uncharacterized integral membrane protein
MSPSSRPSAPAPAEGGHRPLVTPRTILVAVIVVAAAWFVIANHQSARMHLWVTSVSAPLWLVLLCTFVVGWVAGWLMHSRRR